MNCMDEKETFLKKAAEMISLKERGYYTLSCANVNGFKLINDRFGVGAGDRVLEHIKDCISECMEQVGGISAHIPPDEFLMVYPSRYENSSILSENYNEAIAPECIPRSISMRIGRYHIEDVNDDPKLMLYRAKIAADSIRGNYENNVGIYNESMRKELVHRQQIASEMEDALKNRQFEIWLQPQFNHATGAVVGAEALVRWNRNGRYVLPADFIEIFEQNGFIYRLDQYVLEEVCRLLRRWIDEGKNPVPVSVNVSRRDFEHSDFVEKFVAVINKYEIPIDRIRVEITESALAKAEKYVTARVIELIDLGFTVEIDDFGSGYSSLNILKDVPASALKLDMRFFERTADSMRAGSIVESVVRMARWLGMSIIAEGVEQKEDAEFLMSVGCCYIQGYLHARPMPVDEYEKFIKGRSKETILASASDVEHFDNSRFWDPKSMDTLIFNSYVGGACIFEYHNRNIEILRINEQYCKQFKDIIPKGTELTDAAISRYASDGELEKFFSAIEKAIDTHSEQSCELRLSDGVHTEYIHITVRVLAGTPEHFLLYGGIVNITEQYMAQVREKNLTRQLTTILDNIDGGVIATVFRDSKNIDLIYCNDGFYRMYGYTRKQFDDEVKFINDLIYEEDRERVEATVTAIVKERKNLVYEYRNVRRDGSIFWVSISNSIISLDGIGDNVLLGIVKDITGEKETEEQFTFLNGVANGILKQATARGAIEATLKRILEYFMASRVFVMKKSDYDGTGSCIFEVCRDNEEEHAELLQGISLQGAELLNTGERCGRFILIEENNAGDFAKTGLWEGLKGRGAGRMAVAPICRKSEIEGFLCVDNPERSERYFENLSALSDCVAILLHQIRLEGR